MAQDVSHQPHAAPTDNPAASERPLIGKQNKVRGKAKAHENDRGCASSHEKGSSQKGKCMDKGSSKGKLWLSVAETGDSLECAMHCRLLSSCGALCDGEKKKESAS